MVVVKSFKNFLVGEGGRS